MTYIQGIKYNLSEYNNRCPICDKQFIKNKCFIDHLFNRYLKDDLGHTKFVKFVREMYKYEFLQKAKKKCPLCNKLCIRNLGVHFAQIRDAKHREFYKNQKKLAVQYFLEYKSPSDIGKIEDVYLDKRTICRYLKESLGHEKFLFKSKEIFSRKRKNYWNSFSEEQRKQKMKPIYEAEWKKLTPEQRKRHPWVIAGRRASLESCNRGSRNQKYAFELLRAKVPEYNWVYNYTIDCNWQIDIAAPEKKIFIEWDGRHHRIPIHGEGYLNNRKNRDYLKNRIVTEQLNGIMIRVNDDGRFDKKFVEGRVEEIVKLLNQKLSINVITV